jgi:hypothetical protein
MSARLEKHHQHFAHLWRYSNKEQLRQEDNWSRSDWTTVSREAKARRGKSTKTCTRIGRVKQHS